MSIFDRVALRYDQWYEEPFGSSAFALELACLRGLLPPFKRDLEVGVGTGRFASALGIKFGVDPSQRMLKIAKERGIEVVQGC